MSLEKKPVSDLKSRIYESLEKNEPMDKIFLESYQKVLDGLQLHKDDYEKQKPFLKVFNKILRLHPEIEVWQIEP